MKNTREQRAELMNKINREAARERTNMVALWSLIHEFVNMEIDITNEEYSMLYGDTEEE